MQRSYIDPKWQTSLMAAGISSLQDVWEKSLDNVDDVNQRRGGTSSVGRLQLNSPTGTTTTVYIKQQQKHYCRHPKLPWLKIPTLRREYWNLQHFNKLSVNTGKLLFYFEAGDRAVLGIQAITDAIDLSRFLELHAASKQCIAKVAHAIAIMHQSHWQHTALYPKHIFINPQTFEISFIDLETARRRFSLKRIMLRDLDSLNRHLQQLSMLQRARFLKAYLTYLCFPISLSLVMRQLWHKYQQKQ